MPRTRKPPIYIFSRVGTCPRGVRLQLLPRPHAGPASLRPGCAWRHLLPSDPFSAFPDEKPCWVYCYGDSGTCQHIYSNFQNVKLILCSCGTLGKFQSVCLEMNDTLLTGGQCFPFILEAPPKD